MTRKLNLGLALAAGLLGGVLSHYILLEPVHAQLQTAPAKEIKAQSFVLVDDQGFSAGVFGFDKDGGASIQLMNNAGKVIWTANGKANLHPLSSGIVK